MHGSGLLNQLSQVADLQTEVLPGQPLLEVYCNSRVLIEHHQGIAQYCISKVMVKVPFGYYCICGSRLQVSYMSCDQIIINGCIDSVTVLKGR